MGQEEAAQAMAESIGVSALMEALESQFVFTLATIAPSGAPYCAPLYYAFAPSPTPLLVFASDPRSTHGRHLAAPHPAPAQVALALHRDAADVEQLLGVQGRGEALPLARCAPSEQKRLRQTYLRRHPIAAGLLQRSPHHTLYAVSLQWAKLTDNRRLGLGHHLTWEFPRPWDILTAAALPASELE